jgi:hypothetical protein
LTPQEDFWSNVGRYGSYFFSVLLGTAYTAIKPLGASRVLLAWLGCNAMHIKELACQEDSLLHKLTAA